MKNVWGVCVHEILCKSATELKLMMKKKSNKLEFKQELSAFSLPSEDHNTTSELSATLPAHPKRTEMISWGVRGRESALPKSNETSLRRSLRWRIGGKNLELQAIPVLRLSSLSYFWKNDFGIRWGRVWAVLTLVVDNIISSAQEKPMYYPNAVFKERQRIETVPM